MWVSINQLDSIGFSKIIERYIKEIVGI
jgi:hypothetical protein